MKIFSIDGNFPASGRFPEAEEPVFHLLPDTALLRNGDPFYLPAFSSEIHAACMPAVRIGRVGRCIEERFAHRYYDEMTVAVCFWAEDLLREAMALGMPWERAVAFDHALALPPRFVPMAEPQGRMRVELEVNGAVRQSAHLAQMRFTVDRLVAHVSRFATLRMGDLILAGAPAGAGKVLPGDRLRATIDGGELLAFEVR